MHFPGELNRYTGTLDAPFGGFVRLPLQPAPDIFYL